jgi:hypothetical protein
MKRLIAAVIAGASVVASADIGPLWIVHPGFCNIKKIFITPTFDIYGQEVGCSTSLGKPLVGSFTAITNIAGVSEVSNNGLPTLNAYYPDGVMKSGASNGTSILYGSPIPYFVTVSQPSGTLRKYPSQELPDYSAK